MENKETLVEQLARQMASVSTLTTHAVSADELTDMLQRMLSVLNDDERQRLTAVA